jgi:heterotetrameric sarcosine oxidase delta subunit
MLWITCPNCGARPVEEFRYGGELPTIAEGLTDPAARNVDYLYMLDNVAAVATERWFHDAGCRRWHTAHRDTRIDRFTSASGS